MHSVNFVVGGPNTTRFALSLYNHRRHQIILSESWLRNSRVLAPPFMLLIIANIVFDRCSDASALDATNCASSKSASEKRIFRELFETTRAERRSLNVHCWP